MQKVLAFLVILSVWSCKTKKEIGGENPACNIEATVKDFTGLDGCTFLIVLDNGDKLLPAKINNEAFELKDNQRIRFAYKEMPDMMSICMAEKMAVEVTCIEELDARPVIPQCYDIVDPEQVAWMNKLIKTQDTKTVKKYKYRDDGWAYLFTAGSQQLLYDCQGTKLCEFEGLGANDCMNQKLTNSGAGSVIWRKGGLKQSRD